MTTPSPRGDNPSPLRARRQRRTRFPDLSPAALTRSVPEPAASAALAAFRGAWERTLPEGDVAGDPERWDADTEAAFQAALKQALTEDAGDPEQWDEWTGQVAIDLDADGTVTPRDVPPPRGDLRQSTIAWDKVRLVPPELIDPMADDASPAKGRI